MIHGELIVDNFAGGGGASTGIEMATGKSVDIAINHDPMAIAQHKANHPGTEHYCESVWDVKPEEACKGHPVALAWFSPDCKHFSKAKGGKPKDKNIRGLAWVALRWAAKVRPRVIMLENVEEFKDWGPLNRGHRPIKKKKGATFKKFVKQLEDLGYAVDHRELVAADYGAPTMRKRFFLIARCDGRPIVWPEPTHGPRESAKVKEGLLKPYAGAYTQIDFSLPCPSIFDTKEEIKRKYGIKAQRPLAEKTMRRIARGLQKFVLDNPEPFLIQVNHDGGDGNEYCLITPMLIQYHSETAAGETRGQDLTDPIMTVDGSNRYGMVAAFLHKYFGGGYTGAGTELESPLPTVTATDHNSICAAHLIQMNNHCDGRDITAPIPTITAGDGHFGEVRAFLKRCTTSESDRSNKRTNRSRNNSGKKRREILENIKQNSTSERTDTNRTEENGSSFEIGISGRGCLQGWEAVYDVGTPSDVGDFCRNNTRRNGYQPQKREQERQQAGKFGDGNTEPKSYACRKDRFESLQQLSGEVFREREGIKTHGNVLFSDRKETGNITNSSVPRGEFQTYTLIKYYSQGVGQDIQNPLDTITANDRFGLVTIQGIYYVIVDIGLRMLEPKELYGCQGFPDDYIIDRDDTGKPYPRTEQVKRCGNAVCPPIPAALVKANLPELCNAKKKIYMSERETDE